MKVLAIETSCDETGIALVEGRRTPAGMEFSTLKAALVSQAALHAPYGGVFPTLAKREHTASLPVLFEQFKDEDFDAIAVTQGPGLEPALWTGIEFAKKIASDFKKPLLPVNHMEGHIISSLARPVTSPDTHSSILQNTRVLSDAQFPILALLVSGGHTEFVLMRDWFQYELIGRTLDDAVGEAFDKVARMIGVPYPGGPQISKLAQGARVRSLKSDIKLPRPMLHADSCDVSFSGLKTAALYALRDRGGVQKLSGDEISAFAAELEDAIVEVLCAKTRRALEQTGAKTLVIGGGVAANRYLREELQKMVLEDFNDVEFRLPELSITGDNAIMIAEAALAHLLMGDWQLDQSGTDLDFKAQGNLSLAQKVL
ncbi:MAG: tRNA N6-adenosine threonylcarbamoyltransferase [Candidatus Adlerbacteria bacterium]|nr:tRNA N6-adenosine threonylcarbamoyltransferase [Candidatus Adlerbacteria bacterium]